MVALPSGRIAVFRQASPGISFASIVRLLKGDGSRAGGFGENGQIRTEFDVNAVAELSSSRLALGGRIKPTGSGADARSNAVIQAVTPAGQLETTWGIAGSIGFAGPPAELQLLLGSALPSDKSVSEVHGLRLLADGSIQVLAESYSPETDVEIAWSARLDASGGIDSRYGQNGYAYVARTDPSAEGTYSVVSLTVQLTNEGGVLVIDDGEDFAEGYSSVDISKLSNDGLHVEGKVLSIDGHFSAGSYAPAVLSSRVIVCGSSGKRNFAIALKS